METYFVLGALVMNLLGSRTRLFDSYLKCVCCTKIRSSIKLFH